MKKKLSTIMAILIATIMVFAGCNGTDESKGDTGDKPVIELGYVQWACANANSHMLKVLLEDKFDVEINLRDMDAGLLWQSLATGDIDFMVTAWLPGTHEAYYSELKDKIVDLGPLYEGAGIGLVVPEYVPIDSIEEINENADKFNGQIVGIDAGAGIMRAATQALTDYDMSDMELITSSDAAMTAELKVAYENNEWVVVTGWAPHWKFDKFNLKFLKDPMQSFGGEETINPITRLGFAEDYPEINTFLDNYSLSAAEFGALIASLDEHGDNIKGAKAWIADNSELVDGWFNH